MVMSQLQRYVRRSFPVLDPEDVVQATITRLWTRPEPFRVAQIDNAWGYLVVATRYAAIDALRTRKRQGEVLLEHPPERASAEDDIAALIDRHASHAAVVGAFRALIATGDVATVPIITTWLDLADELGRPPSTREVAPRAGVSHTRVAQALQRFRAALLDAA
jgi:RNA polymerase sigma factor (sigma-70 family)